MIIFGKAPRHLRKHQGIVAEPGTAPWMAEGTAKVIDGIDATAVEFPPGRGFIALPGRRIEVFGGHLIARGSMRIGVTLDGRVTAEGSSVVGLGSAHVRLLKGSDGELYKDCAFDARDDSIVHAHDGVSGVVRDRVVLFIYEGFTGKIEVVGQNVTVRDWRNPARPSDAAALSGIKHRRPSPTTHRATSPTCT